MQSIYHLCKVGTSSTQASSTQSTQYYNEPFQSTVILQHIREWVALALPTGGHVLIVLCSIPKL